MDVNTLMNLRMEGLSILDSRDHAENGCSAWQIYHSVEQIVFGFTAKSSNRISGQFGCIGVVAFQCAKRIQKQP